MEGPIGKMRKVLEITETAYASIESSVVSDGEEASIASSETTAPFNRCLLEY